ncbi:MAG: hypothetical protein JWO78_1516 [Micavibrio sp.]|nr:hypothetical protein [Micavibrio sp.]
MDQRPDAPPASPAFAARPALSHIAFWGVLAAALLPWLFYRIQQVTNSDVLWLCEALTHVFSGATMVDAAYEPNPPLSLLIYTFPVLAKSLLNIPWHYGVFAQTMVFVALSGYAVYALLARSGLFRKDFISVVTAAFILMNTYGVSLFFSERDQMIALGLVPLVLLQAMMTYSRPSAGYLKWPILFFGTMFILLKPHHGLIPALMLLHRVALRRNFSVVKDPDFIALAVGSLFYTAAALYFFPDYVRVILPDVIRLYLPFGEWARVAPLILTAFIASCILMIGMLYTPADKSEQALGLWLILCGLFSLIPYEIQGLGLYYQLIPALSFFGMGYAAALYSWLKALCPNRNPAIPCLVFLSALSFVHAPLIPQYPTHASYKKLPLPQLLARECPKNRRCSFFLNNRNMAMIHEVSYYTGIPHASRFPTLWFQAGLMREKDDSKDFARYSAMVTEDLNKWQPDILVLVRYKDKPEQNFIPYFSRNSDFVRAIKPYKKIKPVKMSYDEYYLGTGESKEFLDYDVYKRTAP